MEANNSFKTIMEEAETSFVAPPIVEKKVTSTISFLDFFGRTIELFVPSILQLLIVMTGGTIDQLQKAEMPDLLTEKGDSEGDYDATTPGDSSTDTPIGE